MVSVFVPFPIPINTEVSMATSNFYLKIYVMGNHTRFLKNISPKNELVLVITSL